MTLIAHISDTHFGTEEAVVCDALRRDLLLASPDLVVFSGDITQRARQSQFVAARAFMESLAPLPILAVPGNHDLPLFDLLTRFLRPYGRYRKFICADLAPSWITPEAAILAVNSTRPGRHKNGELPPAVIQAIADRLGELQQPFKGVVLHHPLRAVDPTDLTNLARGARTAIDAWSEAGADLFFGGHIHLAYCVVAGCARRRALVVQAGTAVSRRRRDGKPNSYNLLRLSNAQEKSIHIERRDFNRELGCFMATAAWAAHPEKTGWRLFSGPSEGEAKRP